MSNYAGVSIPGLLGVVFVTLKLTDHIDWSWWWVTAPFWWPIALFTVFAFVWLIYAAMKDLIILIMSIIK